MKRRAFITLLGGAVAAWPFAARAQQRGLPVIGLLSSRSAATDTQSIAVFRQALNEGGFVMVNTTGYRRLRPFIQTSVNVATARNARAIGIACGFC